mmetsp:Transcript_29897/g.49630  ORF Transcript_29897/g.49630 Transcript_29897/m.49630 type:complete len:82 (-) Transcript_29897:381-626(-)
MTQTRSRTMGTTPEGTEPPPTVETGDEGEAEGGQDPPEGNNGSSEFWRGKPHGIPPNNMFFSSPFRNSLNAFSGPTCTGHT